jgi:tetratricopeptide (TPR) repeat protein
MIKGLKSCILIFIMISLFIAGHAQLSEDKSKEAINTFLDAEKNKMLENYTEAESLYLKTIEIDENYDPAYFQLARIYAIQQKFDEALTYIEKAYELDPSNKWYALLLVDLYRNNYQLTEAINIYSSLLEQEPNNTEYLKSVSALYALQKKYTEAIDALEKIEKIDGISEETRFQIRTLYLQQNDYDNAIATLVELSNLFPNEEKYCNMIAELYMQQGKREEALLWYEKVIEINPNNPYIQITLADFYANAGDQEVAYTYLKKGYSNPNLDIDTKVQILVNYFNAKEEEPIIKERTYELAEILIETHPENPKSHAIYADLLYSDSLYKEASEEFIKVIALDSTRYPVWQQLLYSLSMINNDTLMENYSKRAINQFPQMEFPYYVNALSNFQLGNTEKVIEVLEQGLYFVSNSGLKEQFYMLLGDAYHELGNSEQSYINYEKSLEINPDNSFVLNNYAYYLSLESKDLEKAKKMAKRSIELDANENNLDTYGWVLYQLGEYKEALTYILQSIEKSEKPSAVVLEHLGDVYYKLGEIKKARQNWKKALKEGGDKKSLEEKLERND